MMNGEEQQLVAWDMATSGIFENFQGERPSVCMGQTIFGLTSTTGQSDIYDINFVSSVSDYISHATAVSTPVVNMMPDVEYNLGGRRATGKGIRIVNGRKTI